jgi:hypothetical protein
MPVPDFETFLRRARRHWMAWSITEHTALGLLGGCCAAVLLLPILIWRGEPGHWVAMILPSLGALAGTMVGFRKRPGLCHVALLADARFETADLLATALSLCESNDPWNAGILRMADACASRIGPSNLTPHRLGPRAWSGIALALVAAAALGAFSVTASNRGTHAVAAPTPHDAWSDWQQPKSQRDGWIEHSAAPSRDARAETTPDSREMSDSIAPSPADRSSTPSHAANREGQAESGAGAGSARTESSPIAVPRDHANSTANSSSNGGPVAVAGGGVETHASANDAKIAGAVSAQQQPLVLPWSSSSWPAVQRAALNAVDQGQVPDAYRSLVRDYFQSSPNDADRANP